MTEKEKRLLMCEKEFFLLINSEKVGVRSGINNESTRKKCTNSSK